MLTANCMVPQVRGKVALVMVASVEPMDAAALSAFGLPRLAKASGYLLTDNTPDARTAARQLLQAIQRAFDATECSTTADAQAAGNSKEGTTQDIQGTDTLEGDVASLAIADPDDEPVELTPWENFLCDNVGNSTASAIFKVCK